MERVGDPIVDNLGNLGSYQLYVCLLIFLSKPPTGWVQISHVFLAVSTNHWCAEPENVTDSCDAKCEKVEYNRTIFESTIITEWDLVCKKEHLKSFAQSMVMCGVMLGAIIFGIFADKFGRRWTFIAACIFEFICGCIVSLSPSFWFFVVFRFLTAFFLGGTMVTSIVIIMEIIGPKYRELMSLLYQVPFNLGHATLPLFSYYYREWRVYNMCYSIFPIIYFLYICTIPESPRWLITVGRIDEAVQIIEKGARFSGKPTENVRGDVEKAQAVIKARGEVKKGKLFDLFRTPYLRVKTLAMAWCWLVVCFVYYGVAQYTSKLTGDIFINVAISGIVSIPGTLVCVPMTKYLGRKPTLLSSNALSGVSLLLYAIKPDMSEGLKLTLTTLGLFGASITFPNVYLYGAELFPTVVRNSGVGFCSFVGRVGSMIAPFVTEYGATSMSIPPLIFGLASVAAALSVLLMPETRGIPLPETLEDGENFGKKKKQTE